MTGNSLNNKQAYDAFEKYPVNPVNVLQIHQVRLDRRAKNCALSRGIYH